MHDFHKVIRRILERARSTGEARRVIMEALARSDASALSGAISAYVTIFADEEEGVRNVLGLVESLGEAAPRRFYQALALAAARNPRVAAGLGRLAAKREKRALRVLAEAILGEIKGDPWGDWSPSSLEALVREAVGERDASGGLRIVAESLTGLRGAPRLALAAALTVGDIDRVEPVSVLEALHPISRGSRVPSPLASGAVALAGGPLGEPRVAVLGPKGLNLAPGTETAPMPPGEPAGLAGNWGGLLAWGDWGAAILGEEGWRLLTSKAAVGGGAWRDYSAVAFEEGGHLVRISYYKGGVEEASWRVNLDPSLVSGVVLAPSKDGVLAAGLGSTGYEAVYLTVNKGEVWRITLAGEPRGVTWLPWGAFLVAAGNRVVLVSSDGRIEGEALLPSEASSLAASPSGLAAIVTLSEDGEPPVFVYPLLGMAIERVPGPASAEAAAWSGDESFVAFLTSDGLIVPVAVTCGGDECSGLPAATSPLEPPGEACSLLCRRLKTGLQGKGVASGASGYIASLIAKGRYTMALALAIGEASLLGWPPTARLVVDVALLGARRHLALNPPRDPQALAERLVEALRKVEGRPLKEAVELVEDVVAHRRPREAAYPRPRGADQQGYASLSRSTRPGRAASQINVAVGMADAISLSKGTVSGLKYGYGCTPEARVYLGRVKGDTGWGWAECCRLGCGGHGCAYLCHSQGGERIVAKAPLWLDLLSWPRTVSDSEAERLRYEARRLAREAERILALRHPHLLRLLGYPEELPVAIYEYAEQGSVEWQLTKGWRPSTRDIALVGLQVALALRYVHSRGLIHGDVKPGNVFFSRGKAMLGDFSTMKSLLTRSTIGAATPGFRAPEQVFSDLRTRASENGLEDRIDVYQLGNLILYMASGESVDGEDAVTRRRLEAIGSVEDHWLRRVVEKLLEPDPLARPSAEDAAKMLASLLKNTQP